MFHFLYIVIYRYSNIYRNLLAFLQLKINKRTAAIQSITDLVETLNPRVLPDYWKHENYVALGLFLSKVKSLNIIIF